MNRPVVVRQPRITEIRVAFAPDGQPESAELHRIDGSKEESGIEQFLSRSRDEREVYLCHQARFGELLVRVAKREPGRLS